MCGKPDEAGKRDGRGLTPEECRHYRDRLRDARLAALADAEGFHQVCFAVEGLGLHLAGQESTMGGMYRSAILDLAREASVWADLAANYPAHFSRFEAAYEALMRARNDAMHSGAYARHATSAAIELCIVLEEALMSSPKHTRTTVGDYMVRSPVSVEDWQPLAHARQLMLKYSFSNLPVSRPEGFEILSEFELVRYLRPLEPQERQKALGSSIREATRVASGALRLRAARCIGAQDSIEGVLARDDGDPHPQLWLVTEPAPTGSRESGQAGREQPRLIGVLSPFDLL
jgi:CBS domain-containing protein